MIRGINGQQQEEAAMMEQGHALNVLSQVRELAYDLQKEGKITIGAMREILNAAALAEIAVEEEGKWVTMGRKDVAELEFDHIAERWARGW